MSKRERTHKQALSANIPLASLTIATTLVIAFIFRGTTSLLSAMFIPVILFVLMYSFRLFDYIIVSLVLIFLTLLLITTQVIFMIIYTLLGIALRLIIVPDNRINTIMRILFYGLLVTLSLFLGIILTETFFGIPLHAFMLKISSNNPLIYTLILSIEGSIITLFQFFVIKKLRKYDWNFKFNSR